MLCSFSLASKNFRNDRKLLISTVLPSGKCAIQFSESLKEDKYFLPFLNNAVDAKYKIMKQ